MTAFVVTQLKKLLCLKLESFGFVISIIIKFPSFAFVESPQYENMT